MKDSSMMSDSSSEMKDDMKKDEMKSSDSEMKDEKSASSDMKSDKNKRRGGHLRMTFSLFKEVIMMKKLALVAAGIVCAGLLGACSSQGMATSTQRYGPTNSKAGDGQPSGKKVEGV